MGITDGQISWNNAYFAFTASNGLEITNFVLGQSENRCYHKFLKQIAPHFHRLKNQTNLKTNIDEVIERSIFVPFDMITMKINEIQIQSIAIDDMRKQINSVLKG